jgi:hypothetical protein
LYGIATNNFSVTSSIETLEEYSLHFSKSVTIKKLLKDKRMIFHGFCNSSSEANTRHGSRHPPPSAVINTMDCKNRQVPLPHAVSVMAERVYELLHFIL